MNPSANNQNIKSMTNEVNYGWTIFNTGKEP